VVQLADEQQLADLRQLVHSLERVSLVLVAFALVVLKQDQRVQRDWLAVDLMAPLLAVHPVLQQQLAEPPLSLPYQGTYGSRSPA
jgi:hypothetical protein